MGVMSLWVCRRLMGARREPGGNYQGEADRQFGLLLVSVMGVVAASVDGLSLRKVTVIWGSMSSTIKLRKSPKTHCSRTKHQTLRLTSNFQCLKIRN